MKYQTDALEGRTDATWGDEPRWHTPDREFVFPGRRVLLIDGREWPYTPEECPGDEEFANEWVFDDTLLVCKGCGIDGT
jgi:hypothetical protein